MTIPNNARDGESDIKRENTNNWWDQVWSTRLNNPKNDIKIVVQQRIHEKDISGHILSNDSDNQWDWLNLPMEYENSRKSQTYFDNKIWWEDPRTKDGELLCLERFSEKEIITYKNNLGSYGYAGQYQQRPSPLEGGIIKKDWFKKWIMLSYPKIVFVLQSWDTAISDSPKANYSACTTWGVFSDDDEIYNVLMLSMWRGRVGFPDLRERAIRVYENYLDVGVNKLINYPKYKVDRVIIEAKATGDPLVRDLRLAGIPAQGYEPKGDKHSRVQRISHFIENGLIWLPTNTKDKDKLLPWADEFVESVASFPNADSRDLVDSMTQSFSFLRDCHRLSHSKNPRPVQTYQQPRRIY